MSPELLRQIEASVQRDADREFVHYAQKDRAALLTYCRELEAARDEVIDGAIRTGMLLAESCKRRDLLEAALDWHVKNWNPNDFGWYRAPPHLAATLAASRKRIAEGK